MPVFIEKVENHKYKSWKESSNLKDTRFNEVNILFGYNGAGKSSLAVGISKTYLADNAKEKARFFSGKYVEHTLLLEDKSGIRGVVSNFGKKDVDIEKKIKANKKKIDELTIDIGKQNNTVSDLTDKTDKLVKEVVKRRKDKNTKINNKPENKTIKEIITLWSKDYEDAHKTFPDEDYNALTGNADFSAESEQVNLITFPQKPEFDDEIHSELMSIFAVEYKSADVPEHEVVSWLQGGLHIHEGKSKCEFCGSDIDIDAIKKRVEAYINDERHKATLKLEDYKKSLLGVHETGESLVDNQDTYKQVLGLPDNAVDFDDIVKSMTQIQTFIDKFIDEKIKDMSGTFELDMDEVPVAVKNISDAIETLEKSKKQSTKTITDKINRLEALVKGAIGLEIQNSDVITDNITKIETAEANAKRLLGEQSKLQTANDRLVEQKSDLADFADYLNLVIEDLGLDFKLSPSGKAYVLKHADGTNMKLEDISDGERNLLSLIYFYYEMLGNDSGEFKDTINLIIIDDPISSLDDNNKFYINELIRTLLGNKNAQVFVFTHSWDDFCNLAYGRIEDKISLFEVKKNAGTSNIDVISNNKLLKPYTMLYREVDAFRQKDAKDISDPEALHMPNTMRRILEEYAKFRVDVDFATAGKSGDISKALLGEELSKISNTKKQKLKQLLTVCNILSHKANQPKNPSEIHESAKFLIGSIEEHDKFHHLKIRGD